MKNPQKLKDLLKMLHVKADYLIHATGQTVATTGALGNKKQIYISGEDRFMAWVAQRTNQKNGTQKAVPVENNKPKPKPKKEGSN